jgi:hypothetical protein
MTLDEAKWMNGKSVVAFDGRLNGLAQFDPQQSRIAELRFLGGFSTGHDEARMGDGSCLTAP